MFYRVNEYLDGKLSEEVTGCFLDHKNHCAKCSAYLQKYEMFLESLRDNLENELSDDADLRIRSTLHKTITPQASTPEILDIEGVAQFLNLSVSQVADILDQLPAFEIGGRIRFRRDRIVAWARDREEKLSKERLQSSIKQSAKFIVFPGG